MKQLSYYGMIFITLITTSAYALREGKLDPHLQSHNSTPTPRFLQVTLPIAKTQHWIFLNRTEVLKGRLRLTVQGSQHRQVITIFNKGRFSPTWQSVPLGRQANSNDLNFKFVSTKRYLTAPGDQLSLQFDVPHDLTGMGSNATAVLPAGHYHSRGHYSGLTDNPDLRHSLAYRLVQILNVSKKQKTLLLDGLKHKAFLASWQTQWPTQILNQHGWRSPLRVPFRAPI